MVTPNYVPMPPKPGKTIIKIVRVAESENHICLDYDIGIGPAVGYAHYIYQITGTWPLRWIITTKQAGAIVLQHLLSAIQSTAPHPYQAALELLSNYFSYFIAICTPICLLSATF